MIHPMKTMLPKLIACIVMTVSGFAQQQSGTPPATPPQSVTVLRTTTHLVQVNAIALDKYNQPVSDLAVNDFVLTDEGTRQKISFFSLQKSESQAGAVRALPPNTFSNRWEYHPDIPASVTVILLDAVNTKLEDQAYSREEAERFLKQVKPQDRVAIYTLGKTLTLLHDFSNDGNSLAAAVAAYKGEVPYELNVGNAAVARALNRSPGDLTARTQNTSNSTSGSPRTNILNPRIESDLDFFTLRRAAKTLEATEAIANFLARLPGRKNLIWVSGSFPFSLGYDALPGKFHRDQALIVAEIENTARALNNANLAIYPVDARGLMPGSTFSADEVVVRRSPAGVAEGQSEIGTMVEIAQRTGGQAYANSNGLAEAIEKALEDARVTYMIGYYPVHSKWDGKFHKINLQVARPEVHVRYRSGYFALPQDNPSVEERQAQLDAAVSSPLDATGVRLIVHALPANPVSTDAVNIEIEADASDVTVQPRGDSWIGEVDVLFAELSVDGHNLKSISQNWSLNLKQPNYEKLLKEGLVLRNHLEIVPGTASIRVVVRDAASMSVGALSIPVARVLPARN